MKYNIRFERMYNMTYDEFIEYLYVEGEARIKIDDFRLCILNQDSQHNTWPTEFLLIQEDENYNDLKEAYVAKNKFENYILYNKMTLKELFNLNNFEIIELF